MLDHLELLGPLAWSPSPAPRFTLGDFSLERPDPGPVLVLFYLGSKCAHCLQQLGKVAEFAEDFRNAKISILAVSPETPAQLSGARSARGAPAYPFPLVSDASLTVFKDYRCYDDFEKTPLHGTFLISAGRTGQPEIRWQEISYEPFLDIPFLLAESRRLLALR